MTPFRSTIILIASLVCASSINAQTADDSLKHTTSDPVVVTAERPYSAASDKTFRAMDMSLRPRNSAQDLLRLVPGLVIAQHAGGGKAEQIFLRGFDCDHGTDVNISVDDAPVNMISHGHGQGYADLHFVIPEAIQNIDVAKGPYFARYGDLATAGVVQFHTMDSLKENLFKVEGGSFQSYRAVGLVNGPATGDFNSYFGGEYFSSRGYFDLPQHFTRLNLLGKASAGIGDDGRLTATFMGFTSKWNANGQIPERAIAEGLVDRFGSLDSTEGGTTSRTTALLAYTSGGTTPLTLNASYTHYNFQLFSDFTYYLDHPTQSDEVEQTDRRDVIAARFEKALAVSEVGDGIFKTRIGATLRNDNIEAAIYHDSARVREDSKVDALIAEHQIGPYVEQEIIYPGVQFLLGARADYVNVNVTNRLDAHSQPNGIAGQLLISPKANVRVPLGEDATIYLNSGYGFHSNDARAIVQAGGLNSLPRAFGAEIGGRYGAPSAFISGSAALWMLNLESELVWAGDDGTTGAQGRTQRIGIDLEGRVNLASWLTLAADATISRGRFVDEPIGQNFIPLAPNVTLTANAVARWEDMGVALRLRHVGDRPANEDGSVIALGYSIFDLSTQYRIGSYEIYANVENLFNVAWNEAQFDTESKIYSHGVLESASVDELHFTAGTPRALKVGVSYHF